MPSTDRVSINIPIPSSAAGLRTELEKISRKRAISVSKLVAQIYAYAVSNQEMFPDELDSPREKPGQHISTEVSHVIAEKLKSSATEKGRSRAHHCCFILECFIDLPAIRKSVFPDKSGRSR